MIGWVSGGEGWEGGQVSFFSCVGRGPHGGFCPWEILRSRSGVDWSFGSLSAFSLVLSLPSIYHLLRRCAAEMICQPSQKNQCSGQHGIFADCQLQSNLLLEISCLV